MMDVFVGEVFEGGSSDDPRGSGAGLGGETGGGGGVGHVKVDG